MCANRMNTWSVKIGIYVTGCVLIGILWLSGFAWSETVSIHVDADESAGMIKPLLGVNTGPYKLGEEENPHVTEQYQDLGVTMVRTHDFYGPCDMSVMYPDDSADPSLSSSFNFVESDLRMDMIHENGHEIYFRLGNSWNNSSEVPQNIPNFIEAAKNVIRHYTEGLWDGYVFPITYVEVWNEPDNQQFWTGSMLQFFRFFAQTVKELKAEFPHMKIGGPGFLPSGYLAQDVNDMPSALLEYCRNENVPLDFLSWHIYGDDPDDYLGAGLFYRTLLDDYGFTSAESHITEWNVSESPRRYNAEGAALMTGAWIGLQDGDVDQSLFFRGQDSSISLPTFYGLMYADGTYKKMAYAFKSWSWASEYPNRISLEDESETVDGIAGLSDDGQSMIILLTHYTVDGNPDAIDEYQLTIEGWSPYDDSVTSKRYAISNLHDLTLLEETEIVSSETGFVISGRFPVSTVEVIMLDAASEPSAVNYWTNY